MICEAKLTFHNICV